MTTNEPRKIDDTQTDERENENEPRDSKQLGSTIEDTSLLDSSYEERGDCFTEIGQGGETEKGFSISKIWNNNLIAIQETAPEPRDYLRGSDLGKPMIDVWLKMKGEPYSNPPNDRSLRKFESGNFWEALVKLLLVRAGLFVKTQEQVSYEYDGLLRVSGHPDFEIGGKPDYQKAREELKVFEESFREVYPKSFFVTCGKVIDYLEQEYPDGVEEEILEIKSTSGDFFNVLERTGKALQIHRLQLYNYLKSTNHSRGKVVYISRDDLRLLEIPVLCPNDYVEKEYRYYIENMTHYYRNNERPPIEKPIVWNSDMQKFSKNSMIGWSNYLTALYGFENQMEFDNLYTPIQTKWNRVLGRMKDPEVKMTAKNLEVIQEMKDAGFDPAVLVKLYKDNSNEDENTD
jgi:hypothetical protein